MFFNRVLISFNIALTLITFLFLLNATLKIEDLEQELLMAKEDILLEFFRYRGAE